MQSQNAFTLCVYFSMPSQQTMCQAQTVGRRYLSNLCIVKRHLTGASELCIHTNRTNETKVFCSSSSDFCSLEVSTATRSGRKRKSQTPAAWCHLSCLCISSLMNLAMATNQLGRVSAFFRGMEGRRNIHTHMLLSRVSFGKQQLTAERLLKISS